MSDTDAVRVKVDGVEYKVHPDGEVFKVTGTGFFSGDHTLKVGKISPSTPQNQLDEKIRDLPNR